MPCHVATFSAKPCYTVKSLIFIIFKCVQLQPRAEAKSILQVRVSFVRNMCVCPRLGNLGLEVLLAAARQSSPCLVRGGLLLYRQPRSALSLVVVSPNGGSLALSAA